MGFAVDLHTHTRHGSNCSYMEPRTLVSRALELGLDGVCITEHNASWEEEALKVLVDGTSLQLFAGMEVSTEWGDVLVFGVDGPAPRTGAVEEVRRIVDESGGAMIAAHPFGACYTRFDDPLAGVGDLVAALNSGRFRAVHPGMGLDF